MPNDPFYSSSEWRTFRAAFLKSHPICSRPDCGKPSKHVDHKVSRRKGGAPLDSDNCQPYCHSCHSSKTASVDHAFGNPENRKGCDADGWPSHPLPTTIVMPNQ